MQKLPIFLCALLLPSTAFAGAWVQEEGAWQVITTASYYSTTERYNVQGDRVDQPRYSKYEINPYVEYGMWEHTTIGANLFLDRATSNGQTNYGIADAELFARTRLWQNDSAVVSIQPMIKIPGIYEQDNQPKIGSDNPDVGVSLIGGINFDALGINHFTELEVGQRTRFGDPKNQYIVNATLGSNIAEDWMVLAQSFNTFRASETTGTVYTQSTGDDYTLNKLQLSAVYKMNEQLSLQGGGYQVIDGKNTGGGQGVIFAVWTHF